MQQQQQQSDLNINGTKAIRALRVFNKLSSTTGSDEQAPPVKMLLSTVRTNLKDNQQEWNGSKGGHQIYKNILGIQHMINQ